MLKRQKVILLLLRSARRPLTRTAFVKMAFLLREETVLREEQSFYDFVPYKFGPFSFVLYRDAGILRQFGFISASDRQWRIPPRRERLVADAVADLPQGYADAVARIVAQYGTMGRRALVNSVYQRYPWYASRSRMPSGSLHEAGPLRPGKATIYTIGYGGKSVDGFFDTLLKNGIAAVIDVRANPVSRKYGFSRKALAEIGAKLGLEYHHLPDLGIPSERRRGVSDHRSCQELLRWYERELLPTRLDRIDALAGLLNAKPSVLVCVENDVSWCHRGRLARAAAIRTGLPVRHL